ncbi:helix-turn-helix domain-containing protein [Microbacterium sp. 3H14]|nr:helix-turn-helix domain-containing protein [Microbacterium sp. 3H14]TFB15159.1 helix-turn-helix domain-containing protein [Microbacterium sp. 3H14]
MHNLHATVPVMTDMQNLGKHPTDSYLTPAETMAVLRVSRSTLNRYVESGALRAVRLPSGHRRFPSAAVEAILSREPWDAA